MTVRLAGCDRRAQLLAGPGPRRVQHDDVDRRIPAVPARAPPCRPARWPADGRPGSPPPARRPARRTPPRSPRRPARPRGTAPRRTGRPRRTGPRRSGRSARCRPGRLGTACGQHVARRRRAAARSRRAATEKSRPTAPFGDRRAGRLTPIQVAVAAPSADRHSATSGSAPSERFEPRPPAGRAVRAAGASARATGPRTPAGTSTAPASAVSSGAAIRHGSVGLTPSTRCDRTPRGPIRPSGSSAQRTRLRQPNPLPGNGSTSTGQSMPGQPGQLLGDHGRLQLALQGGVGVLEVAAAAPTGVEVRAGRLDPAGIGAQHLRSPRRGRTSRAWPR